MLWVIIGIALVILAFYYKWARYIVFAFIAFVLVVAGYLAIEHTNSERERDAAKHRIRNSELSLQEMGLAPPRYGSGYALSGRVRNNSLKYSVTAIEVKIRLRDCLNSNCETVGEETDSIFVDVPPGQVRSIDHNFYFSNVPAFRGRWTWEYEIASISGK